MKSCRLCYTFILFQAFLLYVYYTNSHSHKFKVFSETASSSLNTEGWVGSLPVLLSLHFLKHRKNAFFLQLTNTHNSLNPILRICPRILQLVDSYRYWFNCLTQNQTLHIMYSRRMRVKWMTTKFNSGWFATHMQARTKCLTASQHLRVQILGTLYQRV